MTALSEAFSDYRVEWTDSDFLGRFVQPPYYREFEGSQPMFLVGGRGTGKTIALRSLHFRNSQRSGQPPLHAGIYVKAHKNRVQSFMAPHVPSEIRLRAFEHYFNLLCCSDLAELCIACSSSSISAARQRPMIALVCDHFAFDYDGSLTFDGLYQRFRGEIARLMRFINDPQRQDQPTFSAGELPVTEFAKDIHAALSLETPIYICVDEWENLSEEQQAGLNLWIKNSAVPLTYKIGVRERGLRTTRTGPGADDRLNSPADYVEKRIADEHMTDFCRNVAEMRLLHARRSDTRIPSNLHTLLPSLSEKDEAIRLGAAKVVAKALDASTSKSAALGKTERDWLMTGHPFDSYLAVYQARRLDVPLADVIGKAIRDPMHWHNVKKNYGHQSLFALTRGLGRRRHHKYYCGAKTYLRLSGGNVRYLLELLDESAVLFGQEERDSDARQGSGVELLSEYSLSEALQTDAVTTVAKRHLDQIEGLSDDGLKIARLVRSLGTAFGALVREPRRQAPEQTSFTLKGETTTVDEVKALIEEGCSILVFSRDTVTKRAGADEQLDEEYWIHPLLAPHFRMPYRRKRKAAIAATLLLAAATELGGGKRLYEALVGANMDANQTDMLKG